MEPMLEKKLALLLALVEVTSASEASALLILPREAAGSSS